MNATSPRRVIAVSLLLSLCALAAHAQSGQTGPFGGYVFDRRFPIGGYELVRPYLLDTAKSDLLMNVFAWYKSSTAWGDSTLASSTLPDHIQTQATLARNDTATKLGIIFSPTVFHDLVRGSTSVESYADRAQDTVHLTYFQTVRASEIRTFSPIMAVSYREYPVIPDTTGTILLAERATGSSLALQVPYASPYEHLGSTRAPSNPPSRTIKGLYEDLHAIDSAIVDSLAYLKFRVSVTFAQTPPTNTFPPDTPYAFVSLYRRDTLTKTVNAKGVACPCNIYTEFKRFTVTKDDLTSNANRVTTGYNEVGFYFDLVWATVNGVKHYAAPYGGISEPGDPTDSARAYCDTMFTLRKAIADTSDLYYLDSTTAVLLDNPVEDSDLYYRVESANVVRLDFVRGRLSNHLQEDLRLGTFDTLISSAVHALYRDPRLNDHYQMMGIADEPSIAHYRSWGIVSRKAQALLRSYGNGDTSFRQVYSPLYHNYDALRIFSEDFDTTSTKTVQVMIADPYLAHAGPAHPIPVFYANPARMSRQSTDTIYGMLNVDDVNGTRTRWIAGNSTADYESFTDVTQQRWGTFSQARQVVSTRGDGGPWLANLVRAVDVAQFKYPQKGPATPVYSLVDVHAWLPFATTGYPSYFHKRPPTPEEIRGQVWLALNCSVNGLLFSCMVHEGVQMGPIRLDRSPGQGLHAEEYDRAVYYKDSTIGYDTTWVGFSSRYQAIKEAIRSVRMIDTLVGLANLGYAREQLSVNDTTQDIGCLPMIADIKTECAKRAVPQFTPSDTVDPRSRTYLEVTHFKPREGDSAAFRAGARYLLLTNKRLWPVDFSTYDSATARLFDSVSRSTPGTHQLVGMGNIDVRRPVVWLKNSTDVPADRFLVEKVDTGSWSATAIIGDPLHLDWLRPGEGALYRVTPVVTNVSMLATAYPNSVKSVNIAGSEQFAAGPEVPISAAITYERDSAIYLRVKFVDRGWSREMLLSDSIDFDGDSINRLAYNLNPAVGIAIDLITDGFAPAHVMVVWEHIDSLEGLSDVRGKIITFGHEPDTTAVILSDRDTLSELHALGIRRTPAIVGVPGRHPTSADAGFVVAWASPTRRIESRFVNGSSASMSDVEWPLRTDVASLTTDSTARFPTLAFGRIGDQKFSAKDAVHLAFQQGSTSAKNIIAYSQIFLDHNWSNSDGTARNLGFREAEPVTSGLRGCTFAHPCIAADSGRIGVSFEIHGNSNTIGLRFRDSNLTSGPWRSYTYRLGLDSIRGMGMVSSVNTDYQWPSLTQFPAVERGELIARPLGALMWQDVSGAVPFRNRQRIYWYGNLRSQQLSNGMWGGLTLAPNIDSFARAQYYTGVINRGRNDLTTEGTRPSGGPADYWPLFMQTNEAGALMSAPAGGLIYASVPLYDVAATLQICAGGMVTAGILLPGQVPDQSGSLLPGVPPSFLGLHYFEWVS